MSDAKQDAALARWQKIREQGPLRFIVVRGHAWLGPQSRPYCGAD